jgi:hypothetical protein
MRAANLWRRLALSVLVGLGCGPVLSAHAVGAIPAAERAAGNTGATTQKGRSTIRSAMLAGPTG